MRRSRNIDHQPQSNDGDRALDQALALMLPIRRQRLQRSERRQRREEQQFRTCRRQLEQTQSLLEATRQDYQQRREQFDRHYLGRQPLERLQHGLADERKAAAAVETGQQQLLASQQRSEEQQQKLQAAQAETLRRQRELEKLECLLREQGEA
ncbi:type III secretion protein [Pantoea stewartii]|uniref:type III secretion protein n=1 Tax=Pantoea stewartii TaxID=66269 RepID=UPI0021D4EE22|nr:type III secretion protein [Pantoea stewartii]MCU7369211.1 type III secretion protein [Pantoea stewartii]